MGRAPFPQVNLSYEVGVGYAFDGNQLRGGWLLEPFAVGPVWEIHRPRREGCACADLFQRGPVLARGAGRPDFPI
jgi:hypothetical protein